MVVIMVMGVGGNAAGRGGAEKFDELGILLHGSGAAFATNMAIEADYPVTFGHYHMQIMADHENAATTRFSNAGNQFIKFKLTCKIHGLHRFVQN